jgi:hypothetical protein
MTPSLHAAAISKEAREHNDVTDADVVQCVSVTNHNAHPALVHRGIVSYGSRLR